VDEETKAKLSELRTKLQDLKSLDPSHCSDTEGFVPHTIPPELFSKIEELEEQIAALEEE
jgi:hypothetical protein